jgi:hypothetical protein
VTRTYYCGLGLECDCYNADALEASWNNCEVALVLSAGKISLMRSDGCPASQEILLRRTKGPRSSQGEDNKTVCLPNKGDNSRQ